MRRDQLEHIIRAAADLTGRNEFIIIGSQAILGQYPDAPAELRVSQEADLYPTDATDRDRIADLIDGNLGAGSRFADTHRIWADGVGPDTATLPARWEKRLVLIRNANTRDTSGWCLEAHDIAIAKYRAGRPKDLRYLTDLWKAGYVDGPTLRERLNQTNVDDVHRQRMRAAIDRHDNQHGQTTGEPGASTHDRASQGIREAMTRRNREREANQSERPTSRSRRPGQDRD